MLKRIASIGITGIIFMSVLTGCSYVGKFFFRNLLCENSRTR
ncbi:hypothetical protein SAMN06272738_5811 [Bacillus sp. JKS001846]|nr:hypothetical protein SAMN06272738_5811 [Bacillus sp. JKS001846]